MYYKLHKTIFTPHPIPPSLIVWLPGILQRPWHFLGAKWSEGTCESGSFSGRKFKGYRMRQGTRKEG